MRIEIWQLISLALTLLGVLVTLGKILLTQIDQRLEQRFGTVERDLQHWREAERKLERDLMQLKIDLPHQYVLREDYVRSQTVVEAKIDALALRLENFHLQYPAIAPRTARPAP